MKPYLPQSLPLRTLAWESLVPLIGKANGALARYDGVLQGVPNPDILLSPLTTKEAVLSSRIEGTITTLEEVLEFDASSSPKPERLADIQEVVNYRSAMQMAVKELGTRPLCLRTMLDIHSVLMDSVRGRDKGRGQFRKKQNYIGKPGASVEEMSFIPPEASGLMKYMDNLERYIHYEEKDRLVQVAIIHAQFEMIHPLLDGNGRVGRILIPLFLYEKKMLSRPVFYLSEYLEAHRDDYVARLKAISADGDWQGWIQFFLEAVVAQAKANCEKAMAILGLYEEMKTKIAQVTRSRFSIKALDAVFRNPVFRTTDFASRSGIPKRSALRILDLLREEGLLLTVKEGRGQQPSVLLFHPLIRVVEN